MTYSWFYNLYRKTEIELILNEFDKHFWIAYAYSMSKKTVTRTLPKISESSNREI